MLLSNSLLKVAMFLTEIFMVSVDDKKVNLSREFQRCWEHGASCLMGRLGGSALLGQGITLHIYTLEITYSHTPTHGLPVPLLDVLNFH